MEREIESGKVRRDPPGAAVLTAGQIEQSLDWLQRDAPVETVALSGGEPLLRPDLPDIVSRIRKRGITVAIISNGELLTEALIEQLGSDVTFEITLLSCTPETHDRLTGHPGAWTAAVDAMANLRKARGRSSVCSSQPN